ncbi:MAG: four helix bundle protein [Lachnospiraceae bacterium]|nr:four helix bundle protein [Lachnospiraceae bacterium]
MGKNKAELGVITKAKELCTYVFAVTQKSPKQFSFSFTARLQNLALSVIENLYRANDTPLSSGDARYDALRQDYQFHALTDIKILAYFSMLAMENGCILAKQYENIAKLSTDCRYMLGAWINSDRKRL